MRDLLKRLWTDSTFALKVGALFLAAGIAAAAAVAPDKPLTIGLLAAAASLGIGGHAAR